MQEHFNGGGESWECEEDRRRENGGNCDFDICVNCMKNHGVRKVIFKCEKVGFWLFSSSLSTGRLHSCLASDQEAGFVDQSEQKPAKSGRGKLCKIQEDDQTLPTTAGEEIFFCKDFHHQALTMFQVDRIDFNGEGNLLQYAVKMNQKEYLQILLDHG